jgi:hypothetical protein
LEAQQLFVSACLTCSLFSQETNISHLYLIRKRLLLDMSDSLVLFAIFVSLILVAI